MVEGSIKSMKSRKQNGSYSRCVKEEGGGGLKDRSKNTCVRDGWSQTNIAEYFLCIRPVRYIKVSSPARKISQFSSIIITIILSYA